ncbi:putative fluoride ion transporter CrcB [Aureimonas sp. SA4125]|uniref:fluoride efflux transporter CrcB n=1 Tax=Aureimonas sp. SA4125 TaxID=2826993 RepID=UPI001CC33B62|nr:fluoride efflux transporter CrcB [Aureimonas sp. SA4125]BDA84771.1 putative fluoride ion transporter CrcB [Aureimonas sp. SA4125]
MLKQILLVAAGGAAGSALRHLVVVGCTRLFGMSFPWGTMTVNIAGSFAMGVLIEVLARRFDMSMELRLLLATGFLGGFTTFSSFSLDAVSLFERGYALLALAYVLGSVLTGIAALVGGLFLIRALA